MGESLRPFIPPTLLASSLVECLPSHRRELMRTGATSRRPPGLHGKPENRRKRQHPPSIGIRLRVVTREDGALGGRVIHSYVGESPCWIWPVALETAGDVVPPWLGRLGGRREGMVSREPADLGGVGRSRSIGRPIASVTEPSILSISGPSSGSVARSRRPFTDSRNPSAPRGLGFPHRRCLRREGGGVDRGAQGKWKSAQAFGIEAEGPRSLKSPRDCKVPARDQRRGPATSVSGWVHVEHGLPPASRIRRRRVQAPGAREDAASTIR